MGISGTGIDPRVLARYAADIKASEISGSRSEL